MPYRYTRIRIVDPRAGIDVRGYPALSLFWPALAAAEETIQGSPLASAWLRLFQEHLSQNTPDVLRWRGDLAESAEMRRAYSALYGRYFSRALLACKFGITDFVPLSRNGVDIPGGASVHRVAPGDIPDWIAWDPADRCYVLAEAKGRLTGSTPAFMWGTPPCVGSGKDQFKRVSVSDSAGKGIMTRDWLVAHRWSTDARPREPISLMWDPRRAGGELSRGELPFHAAAIRRTRISNIAAALGFRVSVGDGDGFMGQAIRISVAPSLAAVPRTPLKDETSLPVDRTHAAEIPTAITEPSWDNHENAYAAAVFTRLGIQPIRNGDDLDSARSVQERARGGEPAMVYGIAADALSTSDLERETWLSGNGIVSSDGAGLFDLRDERVELNRA